jgi:hypothetical protein
MRESRQNGRGKGVIPGISPTYFDQAKREKKGGFTPGLSKLKVDKRDRITGSPPNRAHAIHIESRVGRSIARAR